MVTTTAIHKTSTDQARTWSWHAQGRDWRLVLRTGDLYAALSLKGNGEWHEVTVVAAIGDSGDATARRACEWTEWAI